MMKKLTLSLLLTSLTTLSACGGGSPSASTPDTPATSTGNELKVSGTQITTATGQVFLPRGINLQYGDNPAAALPAISAIGQTGANIVRLQLRETTTAAELKSALDNIAAANMLAMPMLWEEDITCQADASRLTQAVQTLWLTRWKDVLLDSHYSGKILLNIANEWGSSADLARYTQTYQQLIGQFRQAGFLMPLVIDGADCGQNPDSFLQGRGSSLLQADPAQNLLFSLHAYYDTWNSTAKIHRILSDYQSANLPLLIGEFGDSEFQAEGGHNVDHLALMTETDAQQVGWIAWSWKGNGSGYEILDMSNRYDQVDLTRRGNDIVYGNHGLQQTAHRLK